MSDVVNINGYDIKDAVARPTTGTTTSGGINWHWKKWDSGEAECWGVFEYTPDSVASLVTGWYYKYTAATDCPLPFTFVNLDVILCSARSASSAAIIQPHTGVPGTNVTGIQFLITQASNSGKKQTISVLCKGTWK